MWGVEITARVREAMRDLLEYYVTPRTDEEFNLLAGANTREINEQWHVVFADYPLVFVRFDLLDAERKRIGFIGEPIDP